MVATAGVVPAGGATHVPEGRRARIRRRVAVGVPALVMLAVGLWGLDRDGMWRDEAVSFQVGRRTVPQIWRLLHDVDAVHGLYYLLMHAVLAVHPGEVVLRLPSVCAAAVTAGLVAALGTRLARPRVGLWAGLLYAGAPMAGHYAQEGRSYALVAAGATGATLLFVRAVQGGSRRDWWAYGAVLGLTCWLHEFAVLLLCAHAGSLALARVGAPVRRRWGCAAGGVVVSLLPMVFVSRGQAAQVAWLRRPTADTAEGLVRGFLGPAGGVYEVSLALALVGLAGLVGRRGEVTLAGVALPLTVVPPAVLMLVSQVSPLYVDRYVLYALSGAPLMVAAGAERVAGALVWMRLGGRRVRAMPEGHPQSHLLPQPPLVTLTGVLAVVLGFLHQLPLLRADRDPGTRADDLGAVSRVVGRELGGGDAVVFLPDHVRNVALAYPRAFRGVRDVVLVAGPAESGTLYGREAGPREVRRRLGRLDRVWAVADQDLLAGHRTPRSPVDRAELAVLKRDFTGQEPILRDGTAVRLYVRNPLPAGPLPAGPLAVGPPPARPAPASAGPLSAPLPPPPPRPVPS
ncbi:glycosyltransferase family 39 protein [Streptomyces sp. IMTB 2501]|uniref:glycosyltransferase family 39 protein n=1 Tax=Streptomyces sp. IMTB 2501 TaxID=1776340 RepID=UPI00273E36F8|nr:glycosyltransferase family 39 protein [Streptomyces sp. IMTB 2501]